MSNGPTDGAEATSPEARDGGPSLGASVSFERLSYEQARDELVSIVARLESGTLGLEESMRLWERGEALADRCTRWLDAAEERLTRSAPGDAEESGGPADPA